APWRILGSIGESIKREAEIRQEFAANLSDEVTKPMRELNESFQQVAQAHRSAGGEIHPDPEAEEATAKKKAYCSTKEAEKAWDSLSDAQIWQERKRRRNQQQRAGNAKADKDASKQEKSVAHARRAMSKCDKDYYDACLRAELARLDWESTVAKITLGARRQLQALETDRLRQTHEMLERYQRRAADCTAAASRAQTSRLTLAPWLSSAAPCCRPAEQLLFESYAEDLNNPMDRCRRETALRSYTAMICADIEREIKGREGVEKLIQSASPRQHRSQHEAASKLASISSTLLLFLEAPATSRRLALHALAGSPPPCRPSADSSNNILHCSRHATAASAGAARSVPDLCDYGADDVSREAPSGGLLNGRHLTEQWLTIWTIRPTHSWTCRSAKLRDTAATDLRPAPAALRWPPPHPTQLSTHG
uniref:F-BAR domain-containing protein n=1 Tax=Macrostomum lignano TaxID=282301 RepID=A0A1I8JRQ4_9PLAT